LKRKEEKIDRNFILGNIKTGPVYKITANTGDFIAV